MVTLVIPTSASAIAGPPQGHWTHAAWEALPDDGNRYEVIDGVLYKTPIPSFFHQWIVQRLARFLGIPAENQGLAFTAISRFAVILPGCDPVQPDFVLVLAARASIIRDRRIFGVPDLIIEVISPGSVAFDEQVKLAAYAAAGVPEYATIDPAARTLNLYRLEAPGRYASPHIFTQTEAATFTCLPTISVPVAELFAGAPDTTL
jgi:Uma2 family endonuclease